MHCTGGGGPRMHLDKEMIEFWLHWLRCARRCSREGHGSSSAAFRAAFQVENFNVSTAVKIHCLVSGLLAAYAAACDHPTLAAALSGAIASKPRGIGLVYLSPINTMSQILVTEKILQLLYFFGYILDDFNDAMAHPSWRTYSFTIIFGVWMFKPFAQRTGRTVDTRRICIVSYLLWPL